MNHDVHFTTLNNDLNVRSLLDYVWYHYQICQLALPGMIFLMFLVHVYVGRLFQRNEISGLEHM